MAKLNIWETPSDYVGFDPIGDIAVAAKHRDSDALTRSNYDAAMVRLLAAAGQDAQAITDWDSDDMDARPAVYDWRAGHWAVGWIDYLMVRSDAPQAVLNDAQAIADALEYYPVLDEDAWSELEYTEVCDYWAGMSVPERYELIKRFCPENGRKAARRKSLPQDDNGALYEYLRGC